MKPRFALSLPLVSAVAASLGLAGCDDGEQWEEARGPTRICVDRYDQRTLDANCANTSGSRPYGAMPGSHWYYYDNGLGRRVPEMGQVATGGSSVAASGRVYGPTTTVARGGFGGTGRAVGFGGS